ncbi:DUF5665 domain-containing protein [Aneurinibacillus aneurinilyticus]|uniref:DUF5665 domain-containing protein n=1 Tax=Aneurinibacillus aneurinilyticus TaxID=1391 RepID=UPI002E1A5E6D|nr:DUF5665 domain-containing protein [Aneurinibacillus aneurinilyticus]
MSKPNVKKGGKSLYPATPQHDPIEEKYYNKLAWLADRTEKSRIADFIENYQKPGRVIWINMLAGVSRGVGLTIGTAIIIFIAVYILSFFVSMPLVGKYIAQLLDWVNTFKHTK